MTSLLVDLFFSFFFIRKIMKCIILNVNSFIDDLALVSVLVPGLFELSVD